MALHLLSRKRKQVPLAKRARVKHLGRRRVLGGYQGSVKEKSTYRATECGVHGVKVRSAEERLKEDQTETSNHSSQHSDQCWNAHSRSVSPVSLPHQDSSDDGFSYEHAANDAAGTDTSSAVQRSEAWLLGCGTVNWETEPMGSELSVSQGDSFSTAPDLAPDLETESEPETISTEYVVSWDLLAGIGMLGIDDNTGEEDNDIMANRIDVSYAVWEDEIETRL